MYSYTLLLCVIKKGLLLVLNKAINLSLADLLVVMITNLFEHLVNSKNF